MPPLLVTTALAHALPLHGPRSVQAPVQSQATASTLPPPPATPAKSPTASSPLLLDPKTVHAHTPAALRQAVGEHVLSHELQGLAARCGLPIERVAEVLPSMHKGARYDPTRMYDRYAALLTPGQLDTNFRHLLHQHPELRSHFFGQTHKALLGHGAPALGASIVGILGFEKVADLLNIRDPAARFAFIVGGLHLAHPLLANAGDAARAGYRQLLTGHFIVHADVVDDGVRVFTRKGAFSRGLGNTLWQIGSRGLAPEGATLLAKIGNGLRGAAASVVTAPMTMGRGLLASRLWSWLLGDNRTRTVDGVAVPGNNRVGYWAGFLGFFTEDIANMVSKGAASAWLESGAVLAKWCRGAGVVAGVGFAADVSAMASNWVTYGDGSRAAGAAQHRIGELVYGRADSLWNSLTKGGLVGALRWAGLGKGVLDQAATTSDSPLGWALARANVALGLVDHVEWTGAAIAQLAGQHDAITVVQQAEKVKALFRQLFTTDNATTFEELATKYRHGFLDRALPPALLAGYQPPHDKRFSFYSIIRFFEAFRHYPVAARLADCFDEEFRNLPFGSDKLRAGMPVLAPDGWQRLAEFVLGKEATAATLAERNIAFYERVILTDLTLAAARFDYAYLPSPPIEEVLSRAERAAQELAVLSKDSNKLDGDHYVTADENYYRALGRLSQIIASEGDDEARRSIQLWLRDRMTRLLDPGLSATLRGRFATELTVAGPSLHFGRESQEARQAATLIAEARRAKSSPSDASKPAQRALRESKAHWLTQGAYSLYLDIQTQTALGEGRVASPADLGIAAWQSHAALTTAQQIDDATDRLAFLESVHAEGNMAAYDWGTDGCATRLPGDPCAGRRSLLSDIDEARDARTRLLQDPRLPRHAALGHTARFFQYAADFATAAGDILPTGLDPHSGFPQGAAEVYQLASPWLAQNQRRESELDTMSRTPGLHYPDRWSAYRAAKHAQYIAEGQTIGRTVAQWIIDAILAERPVQAHIAERLTSPAGLRLRQAMQRQIIRTKLGELPPQTAIAPVLFDAHGDILDYDRVIRWVQYDSPHLHHELTGRILPVLAQWSAEAVADGATTDEAVHQALTEHVAAPEAAPVRALIDTVIAIEKIPGRHPQLALFHRDSSTGDITIHWDALQARLGTKGMAPDRPCTKDACDEAYIDTALTAGRKAITEQLTTLTEVLRTTFPTAEEQRAFEARRAELEIMQVRLLVWSWKRPAQ